MPRLIFVFLSFTFSLSLILTSAFRWQCPAEDAQVVAEIFAALNWTYTGTDCCHLFNRIQCNPNTSSVTGFTLSRDQFNGPIPTAIAKFANLQSLIIHKMPNLHGGIPPSFASLTKLTYLRISGTNVSGPIPTWLNRLINLESLDLSFNQLSGSIPPTLSDLRKLTSLHLDRNMLTGPLPESFGQFRAANLQIFLSHNSLSGAIPKSLAQADLASIDLDRNQLVGDPSPLFNNRSKSLNSIVLSRNLFDFDLTDVVFPPGLWILDFSHNMIYGRIPAEIVALPNLQQFNVSYNRLCGEIPQGGNMQKLDSSSYMHNRCLCGPPLSPKC
ncbi:polygalacturonase inhibitor-like [Nymphaea colorata]|nr:polygalacturonase inhibitor-like [Nymphaea colorata]